MIIEYCCKVTLIGMCHHNLKVDGVKKRVVDLHCEFDKSNIKRAIRDGLVTLENGWLHNCNTENCEII